MPGMTKRLVLLLILLGAWFMLSPGTVLAQGDTDEVYEFANALKNYGYFDLASELLDELAEKPSLTEDQEVTIQIARAGLVVTEAESTADPEKQLALADNALEKLEKLLSDYPDHPKVADVKFQIGDIYRIKGDAADLKSKNTKDETEKTESRAEAQGYYEQAVSYYKGLLNAFEAGSHEAMRANYNYLVAMFNHADSMGDGSSEQQGRLTEFLAAASNFMWDWEGYIAAYDVGVYLGRANAMLGKSLIGETPKNKHYADSKQWFDYAWRLADEDHGRVAPLYNIPLNATRYRAQMLRDKAKDFGDKAEQSFEEALVAIDEALNKIPDAPIQGMGGILKVEKAYTLAAKGDMGQALGLLADLQKKGYPIRFEAERALEKLMGEGGADEMPVDVQLGIADAKMKQGKFSEAVEQFSKILDGIAGTADESKHRGKILYQMAMAHKWLEEPKEAYGYFDEAEGLLEETGPADAAYQKILVAQDMYRKEEDENAKADLEKQYQAALDHFNSTYSDDPRTGDTQYIQARMERSKKNWAASADMFATVPEDSTNFEKAIYNAGYCYYQFGREKRDEAQNTEDPVFAREVYGQAVTALENAAAAMQRYEQYTKDNTEGIDDSQKAERRLNIQAGRFYVGKGFQIIADIYNLRAEESEMEAEKTELLQKAREAIEKVIPSLGNFEEEFRDDARRVAIILDMKIDTHMKLGAIYPEQFKERVDAAKAVLKTLLEQYSDQTDILARSLSAVAEKMHEIYIGIEEEAEAAEDEMLRDELNAKAYDTMKEAASYFSQWVQLTSAPKAVNLDTIGNMLFKIAQTEGDPNAYRKALEMFEKVAAQFARVDLWSPENPPPGAEGMSKEEWMQDQGLQHVDRSKINLKQAQCYVAVGNFPLADELYSTKIIPENEEDGALLEEYANLLVKWADQLFTTGRKKEAIAKWDDARKRYGTLILKLNEKTYPIPTWNAKYNYTYLLTRVGEWDRALGYVEREIEFKYTEEKVEAIAPGYWKKIQDLKATIVKKLGK